MSDEDPTAEEIRERAEKARQKRVAERAARKAEEAAAAEKADKKGARKWWNWLIDAALIGAAAYLIYVRFLRKDPQQSDAPSPRPSVSVSASAAPQPVLKPGSELHGGPGPMFAPIESIVAPTTFEVVESPGKGWTRVKVPSGKIGWVTTESIGSAVIAPAPSMSAPASSTSAPLPAPSASVSAP